MLLCGKAARQHFFARNGGAFNTIWFLNGKSINKNRERNAQKIKRYLCMTTKCVEIEKMD